MKTKSQKAGVRKQHFAVEVAGHVVRGILSRPEDPSGPMRLDGIATVAIDQPGCDDRERAAEEQERRRRMTVDETVTSLSSRDPVSRERRRRLLGALGRQTPGLPLDGAVPLMLSASPNVTGAALHMMNLDDHFMTREPCLALFESRPG